MVLCWGSRFQTTSSSPDTISRPFARGVQREDAAIEKWAQEKIKEFDIRTPSSTVPAGTLSGGNQQKVIVARELSRDLKLLVLDQPTRGLDVGSIEFIHKQAIRKRDAGTGILLVSAELDEILELSDRIAVMYRGEIVALVDGRPTANKEEIGLLMATGGRAVVTASPNDGTSGQAGDNPRYVCQRRHIMRTLRPRTYVGWVVVPALSILLALLVASILIIASGLIGPEKKIDLLLPLVAYRSLLVGSFGSFKGIANMIVAATPLMLTGLAVGVGLKAGLFNIGATGQVLMGGFTASLVGVCVAGAPA